MKRVLFLSNMGPSKEKPNSGRFVKNQYDFLQEKGNYEIEYFYLSQDVKRGLLKLLRYPLFAIRFLLKYVFGKKIDIIHVHFFFPTVFLAIAYKLFRNPRVAIISTFHGSDVYHYSPPNWSYRFACRFVNHAIFVSKSLKNRFVENIEFTGSTSILSAGILPIFMMNREVVKKYDFVFVGHMNFNKGVDRLQKITNKQLKIAIVGEQDTSQPILRDGNIAFDFLGVLEPSALTEVYNQSKFFINLSRNESFGLVIAEAMSCGLPVIATDTDGAREQVKHDHNGFLLCNDDNWLNAHGAQKLQECLLLSDSDYRRLSFSAIESAQKYKLDSIACEVEKIYKLHT
ncbi:group 1 glycosyl transferase [Pseudoalteromonas aurantia]|uniref:glycosyltransferase family 4 protein n=1 Tax=Pseudoalteromonas aurantia TaxID=43654 RepID=UPI00110ABBC4|nr:glycosyltransferase family 4 protein [Pseudoalteromonas aurantia]TMO67078.1 group 1 glycosyl transferase [Pseudoalteromonas aurantia]